MQEARSIIGPNQTELLAPARDLETGRAAIDCGADAVYIGAARYGARAQAGNALADIEALARYAHRYWARVYVTANTLLYDDELPEAVRLIHQLYEIGADAVIVQDVGLLECDRSASDAESVHSRRSLPPLPLIASTQMHNDTPDKVAFWEQVGFSRAILARELSLEQIRAIRERTAIELECFVHGALCVCYSGQCTMSYAIGGRSGNRGQCAQPCRRRYTLVDGAGETLAEGHLLSLRDLNLSAHLGELLDAGVTSFKIEGRLKDRAYVVNVVSHYRRALDVELEARGLERSSSGQSGVAARGLAARRADFEPDVGKTFNRGYTTYYLHGRGMPPGRIETPKMIGEAIGRVQVVQGRSVWLNADVELHNGDGLCFFDEGGVLQGTFVNGVRGRSFTVEDAGGIRAGTLLYRNHDHDYVKQLEAARVERAIAVWLELGETPEGITLTAVDEEGNRAAAVLEGEKAPANKPEGMLATLHRQLARMGDTEFTCAGIEIAWPEIYFLPVSQVNELRRRALAALAEERARNRPIPRGGAIVNDAPYPLERLSYLGNVLNERAAAFYRRHGVREIEPAAESGLSMEGRQVMRTRYCLLDQLGLCRKEHPGAVHEPLHLVDEDGHRYRLAFGCAACEMAVYG
jgi:collagenase-like PrtC family protease